MNICNKEFGRRTDWALRKPHEEVFLLALLKEHAVVARLLEAHLIDNILDVLPVDFWLHLRVGDHVGQVLNKMSHASSDTPGANDESSLTILPVFWSRVGILKRSQIILRVKVDHIIALNFSTLLTARLFDFSRVNLLDDFIILGDAWIVFIWDGFDCLGCFRESLSFLELFKNRSHF